MSKEAAEHHHKAAEHHELAAQHHREAARHHEAGDHGQPLTTRTRHRDTYTTQRITQQKRRNCTPGTTDIKRWRQATDPKLKI